MPSGDGRTAVQGMSRRAFIRAWAVAGGVLLAGGAAGRRGVSAGGNVVMPPSRRLAAAPVLVNGWLLRPADRERGFPL
jgi:hypothetical protein